MKAKILSTVFTVGFALTGCGVDSIFEGGFPFWLFCFGVTAVCGYFLFWSERRLTYGKHKWG